MSVLSGTPSSSNRGSRGRGGARGFGAHHIIPGFPNGHQRGNFTPPNRGRGRGRGGYTPIPVVMGPPPGTPPPRSKQQKNGHQNVHPLFRGRGGGLGFVLSPERPGPKNWDLATRPLLKPIKFVRAKERLFEADPEELLQAHKMPPLPSMSRYRVSYLRSDFYQPISWTHKPKCSQKYLKNKSGRHLQCLQREILGKILHCQLQKLSIPKHPPRSLRGK